MKTQIHRRVPRTREAILGFAFVLSFIIASHTKDFSERENQVSYADVWVSELALVVRPHNQRIEGFVLEANSGEPVAGAQVMSWHLDDLGNRVPTAPAISTDTNGFFSFPSKEYRGSLLRVRAKLGDTQQELGSMQEYNSYPVHDPDPHDQTTFFTDRKSVV